MSTDTVGGVLTYATELIRGLADDAEVVLATMGRPLRADQRAALLAAGAVEVHDGGHALEWMPDPWDEVREAGDWLSELESSAQPDLVHLNGYAHGALRWRAPCVVVGHSCVLSWWRAVHGTVPDSGWAHYRSAVVAGLRGADAVVAPTKTMLSELKQLYGAWPGGAEVIFNGIPSSATATLKLKEGFILGAGRLWDEAKNLHALDRAAAGLEWPVLVAGELRSPHGTCWRPGNVHTIGECGRDELKTLRRRAAVFAAPARYEPFGLAVLEAAADGCALVLGDIPSQRELWEGAAAFVTPSDHQALRATLSELIEDPAKRQRLGGAARVRAERYSADAMASAYRELYARLLVRTGAPV